MNPEQKKLLFNVLMCTLKLGESTSTLEIFPGTSPLENEIQNARLRTLPAFPSPRVLKKFLDLEMPVKVPSPVFELLRKTI